jgi:plastocyanin
MHRFNRLMVVAAVAVGVLVTASVGIAMAKKGSAPSKVTVRTVDKVAFVPNPKNPPNKNLVEGLAFKNGTINIKSGGTVTWKSADGGDEPHTITLATKAQLPHSFESCRKPCQIASGHLVDPNNPDSGIKQPVLEAGKPGLDKVGDSLVLAPKGTVSAKISAKAGSTLYYVCAIHPWMQGRINVK